MSDYEYAMQPSALMLQKFNNKNNNKFNLKDKIIKRKQLIIENKNSRKFNKINVINENSDIFMNKTLPILLPGLKAPINLTISSILDIILKNDSNFINHSDIIFKLSNNGLTLVNDIKHEQRIKDNKDSNNNLNKTL